VLNLVGSNDQYLYCKEKLMLTKKTVCALSLGLFATVSLIANDADDKWLEQQRESRQLEQQRLEQKRLEQQRESERLEQKRLEQQREDRRRQRQQDEQRWQDAHRH
jgi:hypothetical protein